MATVQNDVLKHEQGSTSRLYHHAKLGGDRTMRAGCRSEHMVFVCLFVYRRCLNLLSDQKSAFCPLVEKL